VSTPVSTCNKLGLDHCLCITEASVRLRDVMKERHEKTGGNAIRGRSKSPRTAGKIKSRKLLLAENAVAMIEESYMSKFSPEHSYSEAD